MIKQTEQQNMPSGAFPFDKLRAGSEKEGGKRSPRVSILTATRDRAHFLKELVESVIAQTFSDWEMVIVDNGSVDGTPELIGQYQAAYPGQFQYVRLPENIGWSPGIALAAERAAGEFFLFIGDDDLLMPDILEREIAEYRKNPDLGVVYANMWHGAKPFVETYYPQEHRGPEHRTISVAEWLGAKHGPLTIQTALLRSEAYRSAGPLNPKWGFMTDGDLFIRVMTRWPVTYIPSTLAFFRRHGKNRSRIQGDDEMELAFWESMSKKVRDRSDRQAILKWLRKRHAELAVSCMPTHGRGNYQLFRKRVRLVFRYDRSAIWLFLCLLTTLPERVFQSIVFLAPTALKRRYGP